MTSQKQKSSMTEAFEAGYEAAETMLDRGAFPTARSLDDFDIHLYAECAASVLSLARSLHDYQYGNWLSEFERGYHARLDRYLVLGVVQIQQWRRGGPFGVANAPERLFENFQAFGGHQEPAHYGFTASLEHFRPNSWIFPPDAWTQVTEFLKREYHSQ